MATTSQQLQTKLSEGQPRGFPFEDFDVMDVMLPEGDDMGFPSDDEEEEEELVTESGFGNIIGEHHLNKFLVHHQFTFLLFALTAAIFKLHQHY